MVRLPLANHIHGGYLESVKPELSPVVGRQLSQQYQNQTIYVNSPITFREKVFHEKATPLSSQSGRD